MARAAVTARAADTAARRLIMGVISLDLQKHITPMAREELSQGHSANSVRTSPDDIRRFQPDSLVEVRRAWDPDLHAADRTAPHAPSRIWGRSLVGATSN